MAAHQDDAFHEIQLNGKQLVFLFMAATVVSVVIFLCGVLVGRGVRAERVATVADTALNTATPADAIAQQPAAATPALESDPTAAAAPPPAADDLTYFNRLEKPNQQTEALKPSVDSRPKPPDPLERAAKAEKPVESAPPPPQKPAAAKASAEKASAERPTVEKPVAEKSAPEKSAAAAASGFTVQVAALNVRGEADAIANRLTSKGYAAYVVTPTGGTPSVFRVRVGKFGTRREAEAMATRLQKEEQFTPWITR